VVQVDDTGRVVAAACGGVPADQCPGQTSGDAEDYAVCMLALVAMEPFHLYIDRQGTVDSAGKPPSATARAGHPTAHLWSRVWAAFDRLRVTKTKAHASAGDIERGVTTTWQRQGNEHADKFAKQGAAQHDLPRKAVQEYKALANLAFQAARWSGVQNAFLREAGYPDATRREDQLETARAALQGRPGPAPTQAASLQAVMSKRSPGEAAESTALGRTGHRLRVAEVSEEGCHAGTLLFCATCGSCAWTSLKALRRRCQGTATPARARQLRRIDGSED
jgi:hypothetical protein